MIPKVIKRIRERFEVQSEKRFSFCFFRRHLKSHQIAIDDFSVGITRKEIFFHHIFFKQFFQPDYAPGYKNLRTNKKRKLALQVSFQNASKSRRRLIRRACVTALGSCLFHQLASQRLVLAVEDR